MPKNVCKKHEQMNHDEKDDENHEWSLRHKKHPDSIFINDFPFQSTSSANNPLDASVMKALLFLFKQLFDTIFSETTWVRCRKRSPNAIMNRRLNRRLDSRVQESLPNMAEYPTSIRVVQSLFHLDSMSLSNRCHTLEEEGLSRLQYWGHSSWKGCSGNQLTKIDGKGEWH